MDKGDYVVATKYCDGDPGDQFCVGFYNEYYDHYGQTRHLVVDNDGKNFRHNGFRRCERIADAEGRWLIERFPQFTPLWVEEGKAGEEDKLAGKSVWDWLTECRTPQVSVDL